MSSVGESYGSSVHLDSLPLSRANLILNHANRAEMVEVRGVVVLGDECFNEPRINPTKCEWFTDHSTSVVAKHTPISLEEKRLESIRAEIVKSLDKF
ncbi:unnamed protein product [Cuscuta campestris]|uniref:Uncharacterized protein n=1 Tax=Cuscuta campestris TaxID=132261 RepID=A0A484L9B3_9ASTE|nr:unnamed protein product [Cuscuta campestris]